MDTTPAKAPPLDADALREVIVQKLTYDLGKSRLGARDRDWFIAAALAVRDSIVDRWIDPTRANYQAGAKQVYYLSLEFLVGRLFRDNVSNLGLMSTLKEALDGLGVSFEALRESEPDAALGNGGLGRLAACFMESMATVGIPAYGYGIRYRHGLFRQEILDGWQAEMPETWLPSTISWRKRPWR